MGQHGTFAQNFRAACLLALSLSLVASVPMGTALGGRLGALVGSQVE